MYSNATHLRSEFHSLANPTQQSTVIGSNVEELAQSNFDGGVDGILTPGSQSHITSLEPSLQDSSQDVPWVFGNSNTQIPAWFADDDFDIGALNSEILISTGNWLTPGNSDQYQNEPVGDSSRQLVEDIIPSREELVQTHWYTFMGASQTGHSTPEIGPEPTQLDEAYRANLAVKLQPHVPFLPLPSTDFLWERYFSRQGPETTAMIQASLIGQTFGVLSGRKKDLLIAQTFHGALVVWSRRTTTSKLKRASDYISLSEVFRTPEKAWKKWIQAEEQNRLLAGIHIHDVEISELFLTDPYLRHSPEKLPLLSDDDLWAATTVEDWSRKITNRLSGSNMHENHLRPPETMADQSPLPTFTPRSNGFHAHLELEGLGTSIIEAKNTNSWTYRQHCEDNLMIFHESYIANREHTPDPYCLPVLWHSIFFSLYADTNRLELVIGKEGFTEAQNHVDYARSWASSPDGQRCALHAALILREAEKKNIGTEPPIHVPRIIFRAALIWFCYTCFGSDTANSDQNPEFPELQKICIDYHRLLFEANGFRSFRPTASESSTFCRLVDILPRVGHWGISQLFTSILGLLLPDVKDDERYAR
ncbi:hypothetical protein PEX1_024710 [Penicillium expansum]|nr:hypothetical protein PEX1_024710 [Penicillium expansum]